MAKTNTEKIEELSARIAEPFPLINYQLGELKKDIEELKQLAQKLTDSTHETNRRLAAVEQRSSALEKHSDRTWQVWLALLGALLALAVAFFKK
ncbi:MAG TPA: hypothetical protein VFG68_03690 [Fimbriiglobus sp.]|nr:hypothetical protein [Fimbriiglobus sp.]